MKALTLRYDDYEKDAVLRVETVREDQDGEPISPPILRLTDEQTGEVITLTREQAWKLRDLIQTM
jgi:hypothetical protein